MISWWPKFESVKKQKLSSKSSTKLSTSVQLSQIQIAKKHSRAYLDDKVSIHLELLNCFNFLFCLAAFALPVPEKFTCKICLSCFKIRECVFHRPLEVKEALRETRVAHCLHNFYPFYCFKGL